jgi:hypothetical protein
MSALAPFVRAFKALGSGFEAEGDRLAEKAKAEDMPLATSERLNGQSTLLYCTSAAFLRAAVDLEQQIAADIARLGRQPADDLGPRPPGVAPE